MGLLASADLTEGQHNGLLRLNHALRSDLVLLQCVVEIKIAFSGGDDMYARALWGDLTPEEEEALWIAPKYGGIFTTDERKRLRPPKPK